MERRIAVFSGMFSDRLLNIAAGDDPDTVVSKVHSFRLIVLMVIFTESLPMAIFSAAHHLPRARLMIPSALLIGICLVAVWKNFWVRRATLVVSLVLIVNFTALMFPDVGNHQYLALVCLALLSFLDLSKGEERFALLQSLRWVTAIGLFYTGLQKILHGLYLNGGFFGYTFATEPRFAAVFRHLVSAQEATRLSGLGGPVEGAGPYGVALSPLLIVACGTIILELALPVLLLVKKTRFVATIATIIFMLVVQIGAKELMFAVIFVDLLLLFFRRDVHTRVVPVVALFLAALLAQRYLMAEPLWYFK